MIGEYRVMKDATQYATAIYVRPEAGEPLIFCEQDGYTPEGMIKFLKDKLAKEFAWISALEIKGLNYEFTTEDIKAVWQEIDKEIDKVELYD